MNRKFLKFRKRQTDTELVSTEFVVITENGELKGTFQTLKEALICQEINTNTNIYKFQTFKVQTSQKL